MKKYLTSLALVLALAACAPDAGRVQAIKAETADALASKTVALVSTNNFTGEPHAYCGGVWISEDRILTAAHCTEHDEIRYAVKVDVLEPGSIRIRPSVIGRLAHVHQRDEEHDLAVLEATNPPLHGTATLAGGDPQPGQFVQQVGHPLGMWYSYSSGDVAGIRFVDTGSGPMIVVQATAPTSFGNSGGGLFNAKQELVGICHATAPLAQNLNLFIHPAHIRMFLGSY